MPGGIEHSEIIKRPATTEHLPGQYDPTSCRFEHFHRGLGRLGKKKLLNVSGQRITRGPPSFTTTLRWANHSRKDCAANLGMVRSWAMPPKSFARVLNGGVC